MYIYPPSTNYYNGKYSCRASGHYDPWIAVKIQSSLDEFRNGPGFLPSKIITYIVACLFLPDMLVSCGNYINYIAPTDSYLILLQLSIWGIRISVWYMIHIAI